MDLLELPFDQYQRYRLIADLCASHPAQVPLRVLDVGGRTGLLRRFLPEARVDLVDVDPSSEGGLVLGTGDRLPFATDAFDVVTAADTLEHVPLEFREAFVKECCRVSRGWAVLAGPYQHPAVQEAEEVLQGFLREKLGREHRYLNEHRELGLPDLDQTRAWCEQAGAQGTHTVGHGSLDRWVGLLSLELYLDDEPGLRELAKRFYRLYSTLLYPTDRYGVVYRHALVASLDGSVPPSAEELFADARLGAKAEEALASAVTQLAGFDRERDVFHKERERLGGELARGQQDLAGHTATIERQGRDLNDARHSYEDCKREYELVEAERARLQDERAEFEAELHRVNQLACETNEKLLQATRWQRKVRHGFRVLGLPFWNAGASNSA